MLSPLVVLFVNAILYTLTALHFYKKSGISVGLYIWSLYTVSAWGSYLFVQQDAYIGSIHDSEQQIIPCLYLYIVLFLFISPLTHIRKIEKGSVVVTKTVFLRIFLIAVSAFQLLIFFVNLPSMANILSIGAEQLADYRDNVYDEGNSIVGKIPLLNRLNLLYTGIKPLCVLLSVSLFLIYKRDRKVIYFFLITTFMSVVSEVLIMVSRGILVSYALMIGAILILLRDYISTQMKRMFFWGIIPIGFAAVSFFWAISVSRFGDLAYYMLYKYLGEPMANFSGILFNDIQGYAWGRAYFPTFYRFTTGQIDYITCEEKWAFTEGITKICPFIFYTFVGSLIVDFGKYIVFTFAIFSNIKERQLLTKAKNVNMGLMIFLFFLLYNFIYGIFIPAYQGFQGNLMILYTIILYYLFKQRNQTSRYVYLC